MTEPCSKCSGTGFWQNPYDDGDRRQCFSCDGTGAAKPRVLRSPRAPRSRAPDASIMGDFLDGVVLGGDDGPRFEAPQALAPGDLDVARPCWRSRGCSRRSGRLSFTWASAPRGADGMGSSRRK